MARRKTLTQRQCDQRREQIYERLSRLPKGTLKKRQIAGRIYYYIQRREGRRVIHSYIGVEIPAVLKEQFVERDSLRRELDKINEILRAYVVEELKNIL